MNSDSRSPVSSQMDTPLRLKVFNPDTLTQDIPPYTESQTNLPVGTICPSDTLQRSFMTFLARNGELSCCAFSAQVIKKATECGIVPKGFSVRFLFPPQGNPQHKDYANLCLMENSVVPLWDKFAPRLSQLESFYRAPTKKRNSGRFSLPKVPFVMRVRDFNIIRDFATRKTAFRRTQPQRENILSKLTLYPLPDRGTLLLRNGLDALIQNTNLYPMVVEIHTPSPDQCHKIKKEYIDNKQWIVRQLAAMNRIPGLTDANRLKAVGTGILPNGYPYSCHHMVPRILGGTNALHNLCYLDNSLHKHLHKLIRVYEEYLMNAPRTIRRGRLFVVLPMPADFNGPELRIVKDHHTILSPQEVPSLCAPRQVTRHRSDRRKPYIGSMNQRT